MARPTVTETIYAGGKKAKGYVDLSLVASVDSEASGYAAGTDLSFLGHHRITLVDGVWSVALNPNSGSSSDVITTPTGTRWKIVTHLASMTATTARYINVPDSAGPFQAQDILTTAPTPVPAGAVLTSSEGVPGGVATLDGSGLVPVSQIPGLSGTYVPLSQKGAASGVVPLDSSSHIARTYRPSLDVANVMDYGAVGDGTTDDTAAITAAINAADGRPVYFPVPSVLYKLTSALPIPDDGMQFLGTNSNGNGSGASFLRNLVSDMWTVPASRSSVTFRGLDMQTSAGHIFNAATASVSRWIFDDCVFNQQNTGKSIWHMTDGTYIDCHMTDCVMSADAAATVAAWRVESSGGAINSNTWERIRAGGGGTYLWDIHSTSASSYVTGNIIREITAEITLGGVVRLRGGRACVIDTLHIYDIGAGVITTDVVRIGPGTGGAGSKHNTVRNYLRLSGTLSSGIRDIRFVAGSGTGTNRVENSNGTIDLDSTSANVLAALQYGSPSVSTSVLNRLSTTAELADSNGTSSIPVQTEAQIVNTTTSAVGLSVSQVASAAADLFQLSDSSGNVLLKFPGYGASASAPSLRAFGSNSAAIAFTSSVGVNNYAGQFTLDNGGNVVIRNSNAAGGTYFDSGGAGTFFRDSGFNTIFQYGDVANLITITGAVNIKLSTTTGTKIGTGTTQKLGFWNATPVVQPAGWGTPTGTLVRTTFVSDSATLDQVAQRLAALIADLKTIGIVGA